MKQIVKQIQVYYLIKLNKERGFLILSIVCLLNVKKWFLNVFLWENG